MPELNIGLYADELRKVTRVPIESITRIDGALIHPRTIVQHILCLEEAEVLA